MDYLSSGRAPEQRECAASRSRACVPDAEIKLCHGHRSAAGSLRWAVLQAHSGGPCCK